MAGSFESALLKLTFAKFQGAITTPLRIEQR